MSSFWINVIVVVYVLVALAIIGLVLLQHGKGADMGSGFGGGASGSLFGATGSANFLSRLTAGLAAVFFILSLGLAYLAALDRTPSGGGVMDAVKQREAAKPQQKPAAEGGKPAAVPDKPAVPAEGKDRTVPQ